MASMSTLARGAYVALVSGLTAYAVADVNNVRGAALAGDGALRRRAGGLVVVNLLVV